MANGQMSQFFGGSPISVIVRLIFLSVLVGAAMAFLDITPVGLIDNVVRFVRRFVAEGFAVLNDAGRWFLYGAIVVVPIWLILRLLDSGRK